MTTELSNNKISSLALVPLAHHELCHFLRLTIAVMRSEIADVWFELSATDVEHFNSDWTLHTNNYHEYIPSTSHMLYRYKVVVTV